MAPELMRLNLPVPRFLVPGLVAEGLSLLVGAPKIGKSWMSLSMALSVAWGGYALGRIRAHQGNVLLLCLEDPRKRIQERLGTLLQTEQCSDHLRIVTIEDRWPRPLANGGLEDLALEITSRRPDLIIIDTLQRLRKPGNGRADAYSKDVAEIAPLHALAHSVPGLSILALHHTRKAQSEDHLESASGSFGLVGTADAVLTLTRGRFQGTGELKVTGRDVPEQELALRFDPAQGGWTILGHASEWAGSEQRRQVLTLAKRSPEGITIDDVADDLGCKRDAAKMLLSRMRKKGDLMQLKKGVYLLPHEMGAGVGGTVTPDTYVSGVTGVAAVTSDAPVTAPEEEQGDTYRTEAVTT